MNGALSPNSLMLQVALVAADKAAFARAVWQHHSTLEFANGSCTKGCNSLIFDQLVINKESQVLSDFNKDRVTLVKADGTVAKEQIPALVTGEMIVTADKALPVEVGDYLLRSLPNGLVEKYEVINPKYYDVGHGLGAHFQIDVTRAGSPKARAAVVQGITNNFSGPNSRVNINSTDNSINVSTEFSPKQLRDFVEQVRPVLSQLPEESRSIIETQLVNIEEEAKNSTPAKMRVISALQSIKSVAESASGNLVAAGIISLIAALL